MAEEEGGGMGKGIFRGVHQGTPPQSGSKPPTIVTVDSFEESRREQCSNPSSKRKDLEESAFTCGFMYHTTMYHVYFVS